MPAVWIDFGCAIKVKPSKLFPTKRPLESVAIDILVPLSSLKGFKYILMITCRFSMLMRTVPLRSIKAINVEKAFFDHLVLYFGAPASMLADNGTHFTSKLFSFVCGRLLSRTCTQPRITCKATAKRSVSTAPCWLAFECTSASTRSFGPNILERSPTRTIPS